MDKILFFIEGHPALVTICIFLLGGCGFLIKRKFFKEGSIATPFIKAGGNISAGGDIVVGDKMVQNISSNKNADILVADQLRNVLFDIHNWQYDGISKAYYNLAPEFTLEYDFKDQIVEDVWWKDFAGGKVAKSDIVFRYHTTVLRTLTYCHFQNENFNIPYPDVAYVRIDANKQKDTANTYPLFYFLENSFDFALLCHFFGINTSVSNADNRNEILKKGAIASQVKPPIKALPFMIFKDDAQKNAFVRRLKNRIKDFFKQKRIAPTTAFGPAKLKEEESFAFWAYDLFFSE